MPDAPAKPPSCHEVPWPVPDRSEVLIREVNHGRRRIKRNKAAPCRSVSDVHRQRRPAANESAQAATTGLVMGYYDGNTVTALWNYAQHYPRERKFLRHHLRPIHDRRDQPHLRPDQRVFNNTNAQVHSSRTATVDSPISATPIPPAISALPLPAKPSA